MSYPDTALLVFAKAPELGKVKTRLQPALPPEFSLELHCQLVNSCLSQWTRANLCDIQLWLAGEQPEFTKRMPQWAALPTFEQHGNDLGERMAYATLQALKQKQQVILVGTDCPFIDTHYLKEACAQLQQQDMVIGPAADGGYVLLGIKQYHADLFQGINWGEETVFAETLAAIQSLELNYTTLDVLPDIDRPEDLPLLLPLAENDLAFSDDIVQQWQCLATATANTKISD